MVEQRVGAKKRDKLWNDYNSRWNKVRRAFLGLSYGIGRQLAKWWNLKPSLGWLQIGYLLALVTGAFITGRTLFAKAASPTGRPGFWGFVDTWTPSALVVSGIIIYVYRNRVAAQVLPHEME